MPAWMGISWVALLAPGLAAVGLGWLLRHVWGLHDKRAGAARLSSLCDHLDAKDAKLQALRGELDVMQARNFALQSRLETRPVAALAADGVALAFDAQGPRVALVLPRDEALLLEDNEDPSFFKRRVHALEGRAALEAVVSRRSG